METAASGDRKWSGGDPWRYMYLSCLPGPSSGRDPFDYSEKGQPGPPQPSQRPLHLNPPAHNASEGGTGVGKGKRPSESGTSAFGSGSRPPAKKPKKAGVWCRLFNNSAPNGCPLCVYPSLYRLRSHRSAWAAGVPSPHETSTRVGRSSGGYWTPVVEYASA